MSTLNAAIQADAARMAYQTSLTLARAAWAAARGMQWRAAAMQFDQAATALRPDPHGGVHCDAHLYRVRAQVCREMVHCAVPVRPLPDASDYHRRLREGPAE